MHPFPPRCEQSVMFGERRRFADREDAARQLAQAVRKTGRPMVRPLVLGIPRGGVAIAAVLARALGADLDVVLSRKLRAPYQPELAMGAVGEDGRVYLNEDVVHHDPSVRDHIETERRYQMDEIARRSAMIRAVRPAAEIAGRTVIVTDDGLATGSTMIAALKSLRPRGPRELIVAVPVAPPDRLDEIRPLCDQCVCVLTPNDFWAIGQFYENFEPVEDEMVLRLLREHAPQPDHA